MIDAGVSELRQAFHAHRSKAPDDCPSHYLLLFYAAECGLKSAWMRRNRLLTTDQIRNPYLLQQSGHDLRLWATELRLPAALIRTTIQFRLQKDGRACPVSQAHEAWRYGVRMDPQQEQSLVRWIAKLCDWIKREV